MNFFRHLSLSDRKNFQESEVTGSFYELIKKPRGKILGII